jgi:hypothetical protein
MLGGTGVEDGGLDYSRSSLPLMPHVTLALSLLLSVLWVLGMKTLG